ncbi:MAG: toll/interleukin-1 receptor domain-containing protein [Opitutae bacterium]|nr:toll/interleukin-1 receptor domain-containing protein [Opitutae bacterium]
MTKKLLGIDCYIGLMVALIILCTTIVETSAQTLQKGSVLPALIWSDNSIKRNVTVINFVGDAVILRVDGKIVNLKRNAFIKIYTNTQANLDKIKVDTSVPPPPTTKKVVPKPEQFTAGNAVSELIWRDGGLKKNVEIINVIRGYHILLVNGKSETIGSAEFQQLLKATSEHPEAGTPIPVVRVKESPVPSTETIGTPETKPPSSIVSNPPQQTDTTAMPPTVAQSTKTPTPTPKPPLPSTEPIPSQPPMDGTSLGEAPKKPLKDIKTDENVSFRFMFVGDTEAPTVNDQPTPEKPKVIAENKPVVETPIDTSNWKRYEDDKPKVEKARDAIPLGLQFEKMMEMLGSGWNWFLSNIVWTGPIAGVALLGSLGLMVLGKVNKSKKHKAIQAQIAERKANKKLGGTNQRGRKPQGGKFKKLKQASSPVTRQAPQGNHLYLCFTAHDHEAAFGLQEHLESNGFQIKCRDLINGSGKIFDNDVVDAIETAQAVILTASQYAYASERVKMEIDLAREENTKIIPIYLDETDLPEHLNDFESESMFVYFDPEDPHGSLEEIVAYIRMKGIKPSAVVA